MPATALPPASAPLQRTFSRVRRAQGLVFVSGEVAHRPEGRAPEGIEAQTRLVLQHLQATLASEGLGLGQVVQVGVHLRQSEDFAAFNQVYGEFFQAPYPVRTTVVAAPLYPGAVVEITVVAAA